MNDWKIDFITRDEFKEHVRGTVAKYGDKLKPFNVDRFNKNTIDPIKMIFDKSVYREDWAGIISNEIFRQRDKSTTNEIGYFHQRIFTYIKNCTVPDNGTSGGWDVIYDIPKGYEATKDDIVHRIYVEMKNKHNTMNSAAGSKTYIKMQNQLLQDDDCVCFLVEAIAKKSQNIAWETTVDGNKVSHKRIRRVSLDRFYEIVTGQKDAFYRICMALPEVIKEVLDESDEQFELPRDTVYDELAATSKGRGLSNEDAIMMSMYMLGFGTYNGFSAANDWESFDLQIIPDSQYDSQN